MALSNAILLSTLLALIAFSAAQAPGPSPTISPSAMEAPPPAVEAPPPATILPPVMPPKAGASPRGMPPMLPSSPPAPPMAPSMGPMGPMGPSPAPSVLSPPAPSAAASLGGASMAILALIGGVALLA